jgi:hypothetical protein
MSPIFGEMGNLGISAAWRGIARIVRELHDECGGSD